MSAGPGGRPWGNGGERFQTGSKVGRDRIGLFFKAFLSKNEEEFGDLHQARRCFFFVATKFAFEFLTKIWKIIMCLN